MANSSASRRRARVPVERLVEGLGAVERAAHVRHLARVPGERLVEGHGLVNVYSMFVTELVSQASSELKASAPGTCVHRRHRARVPDELLVEGLGVVERCHMLRHLARVPVELLVEGLGVVERVLMSVTSSYPRRAPG